MPSATQIVAPEKSPPEEPSYSLRGGVTGFIFYWLAFMVPFIVYGSNTLFLLLYTWPFFLALMPVAVLSGVLFSMLCRGRLALVVPATGLTVFSLLWVVFVLLSGW